MADGHGGYRKPTNPAPVSGPGKYSRRTDGQPTMDIPDAGYGEQSNFRSIQSGAKMANQPQVPQSSQGSGQASPIVGLGAPSQMPDVPVTAGSEYGAGPGPEALGLPQDLNQLDAQDLQKYLPTLIDIAQRDDTLPGVKNWVRSIIATLG